MGNLHLVTGYSGQPHVTAADHGSFFEALIRSGQFVMDAGAKFAASIVTNNQIRVSDGELLMQGRHVKLDPGTYVDLTIENGAQGHLRNDLIVVRYTRDNETGIEECSLVVLKGTPAESNPSDPEYTIGNINAEGDLQHDFPLYRVPLSGLNVGELKAMFEPQKSIEERLTPDTTLSVSGAAADAKATGDAIAEARKKITTDATLSISGTAADAKAVGDALDTKTPIGLNTRSIMVTDTSGSGSLDAQIDSIFRSMTSKTAEFVQIKRDSGVDVSIGGSGSFWQCLFAKESASYGSIIAVQYPTSSSNFVSIQTRGLRNGTWGNWRAITTNDTILTSANWSDFINVSSGGTTTSGMVREFDTGLIDSQTYTTTGNKAKSYNVTVNNGGWHSIVVDYKCVQANNGTVYFSYYTSSGQKQLKVTINSDKTVTFDAQSGGKIKHIGGYY